MVVGAGVAVTEDLHCFMGLNDSSRMMYKSTCVVGVAILPLRYMKTNHTQEKSKDQVPELSQIEKNALIAADTAHC